MRAVSAAFRSTHNYNIDTNAPRRTVTTLVVIDVFFVKRNYIKSGFISPTDWQQTLNEQATKAKQQKLVKLLLNCSVTLCQ